MPETLATEIPTAIGGLEVTRIRIEIRAVKISAIAVPGRTPWRRPVGCGCVSRRWRIVSWRRWRGHNDSRRRERASDNCPDAKSKQASAYRIAMTSSVGRCSESDEGNHGDSRKSLACVHRCSPRFEAEPLGSLTASVTEGRGWFNGGRSRTMQKKRPQSGRFELGLVRR